MLFVSMISLNESFALVPTNEVGWASLYACRGEGEPAGLLGKYKSAEGIAKLVQQVAAVWGAPAPCLQSIERAYGTLAPSTVILSQLDPEDMERRDNEARARVRNLNRENVADALARL